MGFFSWGKMKEIDKIIEEAVNACDLELYGIENTHEGLAVYIQKKADGVSIKDCEAVMKQIRYTADTDNIHIEVSSPGVYPPLLTPNHFHSAIGKWAKIRTTEKSYKGIVTAYSAEETTLQKSENCFIIATPTIKSARLIPEQPGD